MAQKGPNVQQNVPIAGTSSGTNGPKGLKCTAERPYSRDIFRDKRTTRTSSFDFLSDKAGTAPFGAGLFLNILFAIFFYILSIISVYHTDITHKPHTDYTLVFYPLEQGGLEWQGY